MWCKHCQQDVPARSSSAEAGPQCPRCRQSVDERAPVAAEPMNSDVVQPRVAEAEYDERRTEQRLRHIGRSLRTPLVVSKQSTAEGDLALHWREPALATSRAVGTRNEEPSKPLDHDAIQAKRAQSKRVRVEQKRDRQAQSTAWLATVFGLGLALGGIGLMGMGMFGEEPVFWQWGVGVTLAGQAILIAGLVRVLLSLWNNSRNSSQRLSDLRGELEAVQRTAEAILAQRASSSSSFYGELARGASPAMLMSNLKGQIDHLAARLHV